MRRAGVTKTDRVLEIGPGAGTLTVCLCEAAEKVIAVEVDEAVIPFLSVATETFGNVEIIQGDIRRMNLQAISGMLGKDWMVVANILYNITNPILELFWGGNLPVKQMSLMVQKEVAAKLIALPGDDAYGLTALRCRFYCEPEVVPRCPPPLSPAAQGGQRVYQPRFSQDPAGAGDRRGVFWRLVRAGFTSGAKPCKTRSRASPRRKRCARRWKRWACPQRRGERH